MELQEHCEEFGMRVQEWHMIILQLKIGSGPEKPRGLERQRERSVHRPQVLRHEHHHNGDSHGRCVPLTPYTRYWTGPPPATTKVRSTTCSTWPRAPMERADRRWDRRRRVLQVLGVLACWVVGFSVEAGVLGLQIFEGLVL